MTQNVHRLPSRDTLSGRVAEEVNALMGRHRTTQVQLAAVLGIPQTQLSRRLRGLMPFSIDEVEAIADYYAVPVRSLFDHDEETPRPKPGGVQRARRDSNPQPSDLESGTVVLADFGTPEVGLIRDRSEAATVLLFPGVR